ncbi:MAG: TGS domain-containing protein, partial [Bacteroidota bacterium]
MIKITFPDGNIREYEVGTSAMEIAQSISSGLARNVLSATVNGKVVDAGLPINEDATISLHTWNDDDGKATFWHSSAHLMAEALEALYPGTKFGIGPAIDNGFYYDVDTGNAQLSSEDFKKIEDKMLELAREKNDYIRTEMSKADAIAYFK